MGGRETDPKALSTRWARQKKSPFRKRGLSGFFFLQILFAEKKGKRGKNWLAFRVTRAGCIFWGRGRIVFVVTLSLFWAECLAA